MKTTLLTFLFFTSINLFAQKDTNSQKIILDEHQGTIIPNGKFNVQIKLTLPRVDSTRGVIKITKNGEPYKVVKPKGVKYPFSLDLNALYLVTCSQKGYTTKVVLIDTTVPSGREKEGFVGFIAEVELHKKVKGQKTDSSKPVGSIKYIAEAQDFDIVKD